MSPRAACRLEALGFEQVYDYVLGIADWNAAGIPIEGDAPNSKRSQEYRSSYRETRQALVVASSFSQRSEIPSCGSRRPPRNPTTGVEPWPVAHDSTEPRAVVP